MNFSGAANAQAHEGETSKIVVAGEADFGARNVYSVQLPRGAADSDLILHDGGVLPGANPRKMVGHDVYARHRGIAPVSAFLAWLLVPNFGWRVMFLLGAVGSAVAWFLRHELPESPRWLVVMGRDAEADAIVSKFEREAGFTSTNLPLAPEPIVPHATGDLFQSPFLASLIVGCVALMVANALIQGFVVWLPTFFVGQGESIARSTGFALLVE